MKRLRGTFILLFFACSTSYADRPAATEATTSPPSAERPFAVRVEGRGPPMLLLPGLQSSGEVWSDLVARYRDRYTLYVVTVAGFAGVAPQEEFSIGGLRDALLKYVRDEQLLRPVIVGHSLGAVTAYAMGVVASPAELRAIVAVDGLPFLPALINSASTADSMRAEARRLEALYASMSPDQLAALSEQSLSRMISAPEMRKRVVGWARASDARTSGRAVAEALTTDLRSDVGRIRAPVLIVGAAKFAAGNDAHLAGLTRAYAAQVASIPQHELVMAHKALHFVMLDDPTFLFDRLDRFLEDHP